MSKNEQPYSLKCDDVSTVVAAIRDELPKAVKEKHARLMKPRELFFEIAAKFPGATTEQLTQEFIKASKKEGEDYAKALTAYMARLHDDLACAVHFKLADDGQPATYVADAPDARASVDKFCNDLTAEAARQGVDVSACVTARKFKIQAWDNEKKQMSVMRGSWGLIQSILFWLSNQRPISKTAAHARWWRTLRHRPRYRDMPEAVNKRDKQCSAQEDRINDMRRTVEIGKRPMLESADRSAVVRHGSGRGMVTYRWGGRDVEVATPAKK